ncbi:MAG TPA: hypothetical protein VL096_10515, partial [Pirellulaceae bacterium]|nr:hypothetical protein [Pirellulaceae bacterium]
IEAPVHDAPQSLLQPSSAPTPAPLINDDARAAPAPVLQKPTSEAPRISEAVVIAAPTVAAPASLAPPTSSAPPPKFRGKHGFSQVDEGGLPSAVAIELPMRTESKSEASEGVSADYPLQQLRKRMQPASQESPTTAKKAKNKVATR